MHKIAVLVSLLVTFVAGSAGASPAKGISNAPLRPILWKAVDADSEIWMLGSVHALKKETQWRTAQINDVIARTPIVYFEVDPRSSPLEAAKTVLKYSGDRRVLDLSYKLSPKSWERLEKFVDDRNLHLGDFYWVQPWYAQLRLQQASSTNTGVRGHLGVDATIEREARKTRKEIRFLETVEDQMRALSAAPEEEALKLLEEFLENAGNVDSSAEFDKLVQTWQRGDAQGLATMMKDGLQSATLYHSVLVERNEHWVEQISELMNGRGMALIVVGAGHLVGEDSVPELLRQQGYTVTRH